MAGLNDNGGRFILCCVIIIICANCAVGFGYFLSAAAPDSNSVFYFYSNINKDVFYVKMFIPFQIIKALAMSAPLLIPQMIFGGFFLNNA